MAKTILLVEDDKSVARLLADVLEGDGYHVLIEVDGEWALRTFQAQPIDLVVLDVLVPKLNGFDLLERIRRTERGRAVPIVMMSAVYRAKVHRPQLVARFGIVDYLDKPVELTALRAVVERALGRAVPSVPSAPSGLLALPSMPSAPAGGPPRAAEATLGVGGPALVPSEPPEPTTGQFQLGEPLRRALSLPVPRRGELDELPFARLYGQLFAARVSGALLLRRGSLKKILYLRDGVPVFVKSNLLSECLGHVMVRERLITPAQCEASVARLKIEKKKQGQILLELGCISPHNLEFALERQLEAKLLDVFSWTDGKYLFNDTESAGDVVVRLSMTPLELLYEGVREMMPVERVARDLARLAERVVEAPRDPSVRYQAEMLEPRAPQLLARIDGVRTVGQLLGQTELPRPTALALLCTLTSAGLLRTLHVTGADAPLEVLPLEDDDLEEVEADETDTSADARIERARARAREARARVFGAPPPAPTTDDVEPPASAFRADSTASSARAATSPDALARDAALEAAATAQDQVAAQLERAHDQTASAAPGVDDVPHLAQAPLAASVASPATRDTTGELVPALEALGPSPAEPVTGEVVATVLSPSDVREVEPGDVVSAEPAAPPPPPPALVSPASALALPAPPLPTIVAERAAVIAVPLHVEAIRGALRTRASAAARRELERALALAPSDATLRVLEAWVEVREAGAERARLEALLERLQKLEASLPEALELLIAKGELVEALGQREAARVLYVRARAIDADDRAVVEGLRRTSPSEKRGLLQSLLGGP